MDSPEEPQEPPLDLSAIDAGIAAVEEKGRPDSRDILEDEQVEAARLRNRLARSQIKNVKADRKMRQTYANRVLRYLEVYSGIVAVLIIANGVNLCGFHLDPTAVGLLVGSTAVSAIGLVGFIARGLFRTPS